MKKGLAALVAGTGFALLSTACTVNTPDETIPAGQYSGEADCRSVETKNGETENYSYTDNMDISVGPRGRMIFQGREVSEGAFFRAEELGLGGSGKITMDSVNVRDGSFNVRATGRLTDQSSGDYVNVTFTWACTAVDPYNIDCTKTEAVQGRAEGINYRSNASCSGVLTQGYGYDFRTNQETDFSSQEE